MQISIAEKMKFQGMIYPSSTFLGLKILYLNILCLFSQIINYINI